MLKILCDECSTDISSSDGFPTYRLKLECQQLPFSGNTILDVYVHPPIKGDKHFCTVSCLRAWLTKETAPKISATLT